MNQVLTQFFDANLIHTLTLPFNFDTINLFIMDFALFSDLFIKRKEKEDDRLRVRNLLKEYNHKIKEIDQQIEKYMKDNNMDVYMDPITQLPFGLELKAPKPKKAKKKKQDAENLN